MPAPGARARPAFAPPAPRLRDGRRAGDGGPGARRAPRLLRRDRLCRRPARPAHAGAAFGRLGRGHDRHPHQRSRRDAGRTRPLVQDELSRGRVARAARHRQSRPLRAAPRRRQRLARRSHADAHRPRGRECAIARDRHRRTQPRAPSARRGRTRRGDRRISCRGRDRADGDDPPRRVQIHSLARRPRPALRPQPATQASATISPTIRHTQPFVADFRAEVAKRWNLAELDARVRQSQRRRRLRRRGAQQGRESMLGISSRSATRRVNTCATPWISTTSRRWPAFRRSRATEIRQQESGGRAAVRC